MSRLRKFFAAAARLFRVHSGAKVDEIGAKQQSDLPANFGAIILNGLFFPTAGKILGAGLLLAWFLEELRASTFLIGLVIPIQYGVALLAQPWIGQWISRKPKRVPYYRNQALLRGALWLGLAVGAWLIGEHYRAALLILFFFVVSADAVAAGVGNIAFSDTLARIIPQGLRGRARGGRGMFGAVVAGTTGALIAAFVTQESGFAVFALLFAVSGLCYILGGLTFGAIHELDSTKDSVGSRRLQNLWPRVKEMLADKTYRRFLAVQALLVLATQGLVFFSLFGRREFHLDMKALGLLLITDAVAPLAGNYVWGKLADRRGNRWVLGSSAFIGLIAPLLALGLHLFRGTIGAYVVLPTFAVIVFVLGAASVGADLASKNFILELAPESARPVYIGVNDSLVALPTILLAAGGAMIDRFGFRPIFFALLVFGVVATLLSRSLTKTNHQSKVQSAQ